MRKELAAPAAQGLQSRHCSGHRATAEFLVLLAIGILFSRTFAAEAYIVPTGSMAPTLLGTHREYRCPNCEKTFALGVDEDGHSGRPICPNCGSTDLKRSDGVECTGDRLLVHKYLFDLRPPRRWEVAVFQNPAEPDQAYVKRVVGLPGESVLIRGGDVYINRRIARKTLAEQRAMRIPVYDNNFRPKDSDRYPRWVYRGFGPGGGTPTNWRPEGTQFVRDPGPGVSLERIDWLEYRHWQPERSAYGPVRDFTPYNGGDVPADNRVDDLMLEARVAIEPEAHALLVRLGNGADRWIVTIPVDGRTAPEVRRNGQVVDFTPGRGVLSSAPRPDQKPVLLEASWMDRRLTVALDGVPLFQPIDADDSRSYLPAGNALALGVIGSGGVTVKDLRVFRDVYYTDALAHAPRKPFAVGTPFELGDGEYFVLGDNSPVSNDSRFWTETPVVHEHRLVGKPFLVHLPSQAVPLRVFGRELYWIPDVNEIRYIR
jgi:signal peptidase I